MKLYFAKFLPVEGGIKIKGDESIGDGPTKSQKIDVTYKYRKKYGEQKVKLFLCSGDVQVGDKIRGNYSSTDSFDVECLRNDGDKDHPHWIVRGQDGNEYFYETFASFKVIGEVSPEATWVKEGDEFDSSDLGINIHGNLSLLWEETSSHIEFLKVKGASVAIKGPCGHFH